MNIKHKFPESVRVRVDQQRAEGLAVRLCFEMKNKNNFTYTVFLDPYGTAMISSDELLKNFNEDRKMFLSDYTDPMTNFTGKITANVMNEADLNNAMKAFCVFKNKCSFPAGYMEHLKVALSRSKDANAPQYQVDVQIS